MRCANNFVTENNIVTDSKHMSVDDFHHRRPIDVFADLASPEPQPGAVNAGHEAQEGFEGRHRSVEHLYLVGDPPIASFRVADYPSSGFGWMFPAIGAEE